MKRGTREWAAGLAAAVLALAGSIGPADADRYSQRVKGACTDDYLSFCPSYPEESPALKSCMRAHGRSLSPGCIRALVDAGYVTKAEYQKYRSGR